jgi:quinol monooxygenase YgiN
MRPYLWISCVIISLSVMLPASVRAQNTNVYVVTYVDVLPDAIGKAATLLKNYRNTGREDTSCLRFDILQEISRPERFVLLQVWSNIGALDSLDKATATALFRENLTKVQSAPSDERRNNGIYVGLFPNNPGLNSIFVVTHVDLIPDSLRQGLSHLKAMRDFASHESDNLAYEILQQASRPNHFTVLEEWKDISALNTHLAAQQTRDFRRALLPMEGAPYDDRRYTILH